MKFSTLAQYYEKLEATSKRLELVDILSQLFKEAKAEEIGKICYLIQGRVAPFFEPTELGMAESLAAQAIGRAFDPTSPRLRGASNPKEEVLKLYRKKGNMGLAAVQLATNAKRRTTNALSVSDVFGELGKIAEFTGNGTVEKKVSTLSDLLKKLDPISVKHVVNIPLGTLRLGIGDPTVLDALSLAKKGEKGLSSIKLIVGKPVRPALAERLPSAEEAIKRLGPEFAAEPKFDGFRVAVHKNGDKVELFSRNLENTTHAFPDIVSGVQKEIKAKSAILEGEAIAYNPQTEEFLPFQETTKRRRKYKVEEMAIKLPLVLFAFDLLYLNGKDITGKPYRERRKLLQSIVTKDGSTVRLGEEGVLHKAEDITKFFNEAISEGLEGLMLKKLDSPYVAGGRGFHWIKFKRSQSGELTD